MSTNKTILIYLIIGFICTIKYLIGYEPIISAIIACACFILLRIEMIEDKINKLK